MRRERQAGTSLIAAIGVTAVLAILVGVSLTWARGTATGTAREGRGAVAIQAADAGVSKYVSRLVEDPRYYDHYVDAAEDPRIDENGVVHMPGSTWTPGMRWTYSGPSATWTPLQDARFGRAAYSLRIAPPPAGSDVVTITSTAQVSQETPRPVTRAVQAQIHPSSIADFQMISNQSIRYGSSATTTGKLYSAQDIVHTGVAKQPAYAQRLVCSSAASGLTCPRSYTGSDVYRAGAYDSTTVPSFRDEFPTPIDFAQFTRTRLDIQDASLAGGIHRNDPSASAWLLQFLSDGRVKIWKVTSSGDVGRRLNRLRCPETVALPVNGALYFEQSVVVSDGSGLRDDCGGQGRRDSVLRGRVTVATKGNVYIGGDIDYSGDDVLGLIAAEEVVIAEYTPRVLAWRAATLAQSGKWRTNRGSSDGRHDLMVYRGAQATADGGYASMFDRREYHYDENLQRLRPPFYPIIEGSWTTRYWREVTPPR